MIICPWCGTNYLTFQSNCKNCGGRLPAVAETIASSVSTENIPTPPPAPRPISERYVWRLLSTDGTAIAGGILGFIGAIFSLIGAGLTAGVVTAIVGIPFLLIGVVLLGIGGWMAIRRYQAAQKVVDVLRVGEATQGQIIELQEDYSVLINGRHPWSIRYQFQVNGQDHEGKVTTLNPVGDKLQEGKPVCILYLPTTPQWNSIYPHP